MRELTPLTLAVGLAIAVVMTAANVYLGLYAGLTVSASIPAAVIAAGIIQGLLKRRGVLEANIVQTMASAGESLAAGIIFTVPALVIVGAWQDFAFWPTTLIGISGGLLGVVFMIPLRRTLIHQQKNLSYPEGVACARVLEASSQDSKQGFWNIGVGLAAASFVKLLTAGLGLVTASFERAIFLSGRTLYFGADISPALVGIGYIVQLRIAALVFAGGALAWLIAIPLFPLGQELLSSKALEVAWTLWSERVRYIGVGAMLVGGAASVVSVRSGMLAGLKQLGTSFSQRHLTHDRTDSDMRLPAIGTLLTVCFAIMLGLYWTMLDSLGLSLFTTIIMITAAFPFVAVSSYIVGLVGSSNNPVSGITIGALLATSALFFALGLKGDTAILVTLGVAAVVCCAACTAGDCSQDLKTGSIIGATPRLQQWAQVIGIVVPAFTIPPVLTLLHSAYGIGSGLKAPQATLFASLTQAFFGNGSLPIDMLIFGIGLGFIMLVCDIALSASKYSFRLHVMPTAIGMYLPLSLSVPIFIGGLIHAWIHRRSGDESLAEDRGVLVSSGLIAGEAIIGVVIAAFIAAGLSLKISLWGSVVADTLAWLSLFAVGLILYRSRPK